MLHFRERSLALWSFSVLIFLSGCGPQVECDSPETRSAVLKIVADDHRNALGVYAARNSNVAKEEAPNAGSEVKNSSNSDSAKPLYLLGEKIATTSTSEDARTRTCSGSISVIVGDTKASKEVNFTVQKQSNGKVSVSVEPFQF